MLRYPLRLMHGDQIRGRMTQLISSLAEFRRLPFGVASRVVVSSILLQALTAAFVLLVLRAAGIDAPLSVSIWLVPVLTVVHLLPISIAGTGIREVTLVLVLQNTHFIDPARSMVASLLILFVGVVAGAIGGCIALWGRYAPSK